MYIVKGNNDLATFGVMMILFQIVPDLVFYKLRNNSMTMADAK